MFSRAAPPFAFLDAPQLFTLIDHELELVEPDARYVDDLLAACRHPLTQDLMPAQAKQTREELMRFLSQNPRGRWRPDARKGVTPAYTFWMRMRKDAVPLPSAADFPDVAMAGSISLRLGHSENLDRYLGHIGYHVLPPARGHHFAERASRLLLPLARAHGQKVLWITCNPDNIASRRTCERMGAVFVNTIAVPSGNALYSQGDREKARYRLDL
jgi:predicted acetyltransferase